MITWNRAAAEDFYATAEEWHAEARALGPQRMADSDAADHALNVLHDISTRRWLADQYPDVHRAIIAARDAVAGAVLAINNEIANAHVRE